MLNLQRGELHTTINDNGAWVDELTDQKNAIFYPKTIIRSESGEEKIRGGMHVCLPNFGPGGDSGLAQHGFGRTSTWDVLHKTGSSAMLTLKGGTTHYAQLESTLAYELSENSLRASLTLTNHGALSLRIAPAFHPYFALDETETAVKINNVTYELSALAGTEFIEAEHVELVTVHRTLQLSQTGLTTWAIWTDLLGSYVCVEPTFGGYRFLEPENPGEPLGPHESRSFSFDIMI